MTTAAGQKAGPVRVGLLVENLGTGERLVEHNASQAFRPASNVKLFPAATALYALGPNERYTTRLTTLELGAVLPHATLVRSGDPTFRVTEEDSLEALARQLVKAGVQEVGAVVVNDRLFRRPWLLVDDATLVSAVHLADLPAMEGEQRPARDARQFKPWAPASYVDAVAFTFEHQLQRAGIRVAGPARLAPAVTTEPVVASVQGEPLRTLLAGTFKLSNNVHAEHLFAGTGLLGSEPPPTPKEARAAIPVFMDRANIDRQGVVLVDGSGLSRNNRLTPDAAVQLLGLNIGRGMPTEIVMDTIRCRVKFRVVPATTVALACSITRLIEASREQCIQLAGDESWSATPQDTVV